jgi:hypothetical protein
MGSGTAMWCLFLHTVCHCVTGCFAITHITGVPLSLAVNVVNTPRRRLLKSFPVSSLPAGVTYAISMEYIRKYSNLVGIPSPLCGFFESSSNCHFRIHAAVSDPWRLLSVHKRCNSRVRHLTSMCCSAHPPWIRSPDRPSRSQSLYRLSYPDPH